MAIKLIPLPYSANALAPAISAQTLETHHGKHHKAYVDKTNAEVKGGELAGASLEAVIATAEAKSLRGLFHNAAQAWNHGFYWHSLTPGQQAPGGELARAIDAAFGSFDALKEELSKQGEDHFAAGWLWLVAQDATLKVLQSHDAGTLAIGDAMPLLVIDLWEHAYYLDHQNLRPDYLSAVIDRHLNWAFAAENLSRGTTWTYPG